DTEDWSTTTGNGFNAKVGVIYNPIDYLQIGVTATTPTWYKLTNDYEDYFGITNYLTDGSSEPPFTSEGEPTYYDYNLRTPYRINGGIAALFDQDSTALMGRMSTTPASNSHRSMRTPKMARTDKTATITTVLSTSGTGGETRMARPSF